MKKPRIIKTRKAGKKHQVHTVSGGNGAYCTSPCEQCPWRVDQVGEFPAQAFEHSANTSYDMAMQTFACHMAGAEKPTTCAGFLLKGAVHNLLVRVRCMQGQIDLTKISENGHKLFDNYRQMAEANGVSPDSPALKQCRSDNDADRPIDRVPKRRTARKTRRRDRSADAGPLK